MKQFCMMVSVKRLSVPYLKGHSLRSLPAFLLSLFPSFLPPSGAPLLFTTVYLILSSAFDFLAS